ncbi:DUF4303 domain-containing protein [Aeromonas hydrophila]
MDWKKFEDECFDLTLSLVNGLVCENKDDVIYALCLYTDSSAMTVSLSANTERGFSESINANEDNDDEMVKYYRWAFSEWLYDAYEASKFSGISNNLRGDTLRDIDFNSFFKKLIVTLTQVLCRIRDENINALDKTVFFVSITDDDDSEAIENGSAKIINSDMVYRKFISRYD